MIGSVTASDSQSVSTVEKKSASEDRENELFQSRIQPMLGKYCQRCHNEQTMKSGIRVDHLDGTFQDRHLFLWKDILKQISDDAMPPKEELQPSADERQKLVAAIREAMNLAMKRQTQKNGSVRRLTVSQYRNTLRDLLALEEDLTEVLPPDGVSKDGFANNGQILGLTPLQMEYYFEIAEKAIDLSVVDESAKPVIQTFRMDLGKGINETPCPDNLILGADNLLLRNEDFRVVELSPTKPFAYQPFAMRTAYEFIEGYVGNDTIRGWKKFDSIYHSVFACMRGTKGYPKGEPYRAIPGGLLLRPAIPSSEIFGQSSTYGPMANFKISLRELPDRGNFRVTVMASRYDDGLMLETGSPIQKVASADAPSTDVVTAEFKPDANQSPSVNLVADGIYQVDVDYEMLEKKDLFSLVLDKRHFSREFPNTSTAENSTANAPANDKKDKPDQAICRDAFLICRLAAGPHELHIEHGATTKI
ncbi:MAG: DUF1587 domain-containing protein, partial [Planctomycetes bacterium]|nr:DUF1587 domain-containing protein [Planctomycetota bacterium]